MSASNGSAVDWQAVVAASMDGVGIVEDGVFVHVNDRFAGMHGYDDPAELVGEPWRVTCSPAGRERVADEVLPGVRRDGAWRGAVAGRRADGTTFPRELSIREGDGGALVWVARGAGDDLDGGHGGPPEDDRRPNDDRQRDDDRRPDDDRGRDRYRRLFEDAPVPIGVFTDDLEIVYCNRAAVEFLGASDAEAVLGRSPRTFVPSGDHERVGKRIRRVIEGREPTEPLAQRFVGLDGEERIAEVATAPVRFDGEPAAQVVLNDVTSYERTRKRLREERRFVQDVIDALDDVFYVIDEDGGMALWNDALAERTGYTDEEIAEIEPKEFLPAAQGEFVPGLGDDVGDLDDRHVDLDLVTNEDERLPHEFRGTTIEDSETGRLYRCGVARDITDRLERERELGRYETIVETVEDGLYALDEDLRFSFVNDGLCELLGLSREDLLGERVTGLMLEEDAKELAADVRERTVRGDLDTGTIAARAETDDGIVHLECRYKLFPEPDGEFRGSVGVIRDVTERVERERELERQRDELATLDRINELLLEVTHELVGAASHEAIERTVCERLADSERYRFAWTGRREYDADELVPGASAGDGGGYLDAVTVGDDAARDPAWLAVRTGEVRVANVDSPAFEPRRAAALDRGFRSVAAVPLRHGGTTYGVLEIYATDPDAFSEREQHGLSILGETVGFVMGAVKRRRLLFADAVVELEFRVGDPEAFLTGVTDGLDCRLDLDGYVSAGDRWLLYLDVDGPDADRVAAAAADEPSVDRVRTVGDDGEGDRLELVTAGASLLHRVAPAGLQVRSATFEDGVGHLVLDAPGSADVNHVADLVDAAFDDSKLVAQRERDRTPEVPRPASGVTEDLTDRQRESLEAAYRSGYFDWPRASTAEEVADGLGVAPPTFHGHVRKAERAVFSTLFD